MSASIRGHVLVIAPAHGRGGIASVVRLHSQTPAWRATRCKLLSTYDDRSVWHKLVTAAKAYVAMPFLVGRANIVHIHLAAQRSVLRKLPFVLLAKLLNKPLIIHVHASSVESLYDDTAFSAGRYCLSLADEVVALSDSWAKALKARDQSLRLCVIPNPVVLKPRPDGGDKAAVILYAGKLEPRKGYQDLLNAAVCVLAQFPEAEFWFAGHGELQQAIELADRLGIRQSVRFMGWLCEEDMAKAYDAASVCCLPSYNEGVPMVVLEAMAHGVPVVCTRVGGLPDIVHDGENGLFAIPGEPQTIAAAILRLLADPAYAHKIALNASHTVESRCSLSAVSKQLENLYQRFLVPCGPQRTAKDDGDATELRTSLRQVASAQGNETVEAVADGR